MTYLGQVGRQMRAYIITRSIKQKVNTRVLSQRKRLFLV